MNIRVILLSCVLCVPLCVSGQLLPKSLMTMTSNYQLLEDALSGTVGIVTSSYALCDGDNNYFGRNDEDYFSRVPFVAVLTERGIVTASTVATPWTIDSDYAEYAADYTAVLSSSTMTIVNGAGTTTNIDPSLWATGESVREQVRVVTDSLLCPTGLMVDSICGHKEGWCVWYTCGETLTADSIRMGIQREEFTVSSPNEVVAVTPVSTTDHIVGGIYVITMKSAPGQTTYLLSGYAVRDGDSWQMVFPFLRAAEQVSHLTAIQREVPSEEFNPLQPQETTTDEGSDESSDITTIDPTTMKNNSKKERNKKR